MKYRYIPLYGKVSNNKRFLCLKNWCVLCIFVTESNLTRINPNMMVNFPVGRGLTLWPRIKNPLNTGYIKLHFWSSHFYNTLSYPVVPLKGSVSWSAGRKQPAKKAKNCGEKKRKNTSGQNFIYLLIDQFWQILSILEHYRCRLDMRYGGGQRLFNEWRGV